MKRKLILLSLALFSFCFVLVAQENLSAVIAGKSSGEISERQIIGAGLQVNNDQYEVISFDMSYKKPDGSKAVHSVEGSRFQTKAVLHELNTLPDGTQIVFENIKCKKKDTHEIIHLPNLTFTLMKTQRIK